MALTYDKDIDYSNILKNLMENGGTAEEVGDVLKLRTEKATSEPGLAQYANDNIYQSALNYIAHYKEPSETAGTAGSTATLSGTAGQINALTGELLNREKFSYDYTADPLYTQYEKTYTRQGERAMQDTVGQVSARTGGLASSYASTAGQQSYNDYMAALSDKIPELYQQAYERYLDEYSMKRDDLSELKDQEATSYSRQKEREETDYSRTLDRISLDTEQQQTAIALRQQEIENALNIWTTNGYATQAVADVLGVPAGTPTTDQSYNNWYTSYTQNKVSGGDSGTGSGGGSGSGGSADQDAELSDAETAFNAGDYSDSVIQALVDQGYTQAMIEQAGYKGNYFTGNMENTGAAKLGTAARKIAANLAKSYGTVTQKVSMIEAAVNAGTITEAEADILLTSIGM